MKANVCGDLVFDELMRFESLDRDQLLERIRKDVPTFKAQHVAAGVRWIRDCLGDHAIICLRTTGEGRRRPYMIDPDRASGTAYYMESVKRTLTEARHISSGLDWLAKTYGNKGAIRNARRHQNYAIEELEEALANL